MAMAQSLKAKAEDIKSRVETRVKEIRGGSAGLLNGLGGGTEGLFGGKLAGMLGTRGGGGFLSRSGTGVLSNVKILQEVKTKGVMTAAQDRFKKLRGGSSGLLAGGPSIGEKVSVEKDGGGPRSIKRRLAIEA